MGLSTSQESTRPSSQIRSMTGFGQASLETDTHLYQVEIRSVNSKTLDLTVRLPREFGSYELEVRTLVQRRLERGKISVFVNGGARLGRAASERINEGLIKERFAVLSRLADELGAGLSAGELLKLAYGNGGGGIIGQPAGEGEANGTDLSTNTDSMPNEGQTLWAALLGTIDEALMRCDQHRADEGQALADALKGYIRIIRHGLEAVIHLEPARAPRIRQRLETKLSEIAARQTLDGGRLEQEMIYHIERLDISEEIVRLGNHLEYFLTTLESEAAPGKKLSFIAQEIGREVNTIGSKANDPDIQRQVVSMKEELEKIKEQLANLL